jgi:hypothetical protein
MSKMKKASYKKAVGGEEEGALAAPQRRKALAAQLLELSTPTPKGTYPFPCTLLLDVCI